MVVPVLGEVATPPPAAAPAEAPAAIVAPAPGPLPKPAALAFTGENVDRMVRRGLQLVLLGGLLVLLSLVRPTRRRRRGVTPDPAPAIATSSRDTAPTTSRDGRVVRVGLRLLALGVVLFGGHGRRR